MVDPVQLLEGMERMLARRARPIPVHVVRRCLRVAAEALRPLPAAAVSEAAQEAAERAQEGLADAVAAMAPMPRRRTARASGSSLEHEPVRAAVKARKLERGLDWQALADEMGLRRQTLKNWMAGEASERTLTKARAWLAEQPKDAPVQPLTEAPPTIGVDLAARPDETRLVPVTERAMRTMEAAPVVVAPPPMSAPTARVATPMMRAFLSNSTAAPAPRKPVDEDETVATTHKAVRHYLVARLIASGVGKLLAADRVALLTHAEALEQANERRVAAGQRPFRFVGTASNEKAA